MSMANARHVVRVMTTHNPRPGISATEIGWGTGFHTVPSMAIAQYTGLCEWTSSGSASSSVLDQLLFVKHGLLNDGNAHWVDLPSVVIVPHAAGLWMP